MSSPIALDRGACSGTSTTGKGDAAASRHTCATNLLRHGTDTATIALWLGHEDVRTTYGVYLHADLRLKEAAIAKTAPPGTRPG